MIAGLSDQIKPKRTNIASTLCARDYKGPGNITPGTVVYEDSIK